MIHRIGLLFLSTILLTHPIYSEEEAIENAEEITQAPNEAETTEENLESSEEGVGNLEDESSEEVVEEGDNTISADLRKAIERSEALQNQINQTVDEDYETLEEENIDLSNIVLSDLPDSAENLVVVFLDDENLVMQLLPSAAPTTVSEFRKLVRDKFYDNTEFFRLIPNYIIQAGDPTSSAYGGSGKRRSAEISEATVFKRGTVAMSNLGDLDSDDSQFFIAYNGYEWLNGQYTIFGQLISGMSYLETLEGNYQDDGFLEEPIIINRVAIMSDLEREQQERILQSLEESEAINRELNQQAADAVDQSRRENAEGEDDATEGENEATEGEDETTPSEGEEITEEAVVEESSEAEEDLDELSNSLSSQINGDIELVAPPEINPYASFSGE